MLPRIQFRQIESMTDKCSIILGTKRSGADEPAVAVEFEFEETAADEPVCISTVISDFKTFVTQIRMSVGNYTDRGISDGSCYFKLPSGKNIADRIYKSLFHFIF